MKEVFVDGDIVYLKKDFLGWHVYHPIKEDGKINWKNLIAGGSWIKLITVITFVVIALGAIFEVVGIVNSLTECINQTTPIQNPIIIMP